MKHVMEPDPDAPGLRLVPTLWALVIVLGVIDLLLDFVRAAAS